MKITFMPKAKLGKWAVVLSATITILTILKSNSVFIPIPSLILFGIGFVAFIMSIIALIKKDRAILLLLPVLIGILIIVWTAAEIIYPH